MANLQGALCVPTFNFTCGVAGRTEKKLMEEPAQLADLQGALCVPTFNFTKDRQRCFRGFSAGLEGRTAWMMNEWRELDRVDYPWAGCLRAPLLSNTETIKWRKIYVPIPIIRNSTKNGEMSVNTYHGPKQ